MKNKLYRKAFAGVALAVSLLITGALPKTGVHDSYAADLSNSDLLAQSSSSGPVDLLATEDSLGDSSDVIADMVRSSVTSRVDPVSGFSQARSLSASISVQNAVEIAQADSVPVDDTFAPLTTEELRQQLLIDPNFVPGAPRPSPGSSFGTPSAYGADWGDAFIGISGVSRGENDDKADGSIGLGMGFGDAINNIGVEVSVGIISLDGFGEDGSVGFKLHKVFPGANNLAVALGWSNPITWGDANNAEDTFYGVVTQRFELYPGQADSLPITASLGVGTGSFRSKGAIEDGNNDPNVFGSIGIRATPEVSVATSWTGSALNVGVSAAPFDFPLIVTAGLSDVTNNTDSGTRINASMGYSFSF